MSASPSSGSHASAAVVQPARRAPVRGEPTTISGVGWSYSFSCTSPGHGPAPLRIAAWKPSRCRSTRANEASMSSGMSGWRSRQRPRRGRNQRCANDGSIVTRSPCPAPLAAAAAACTPSSTCASAGATWRSSACPAALRCTRRPRGSNSAKPRRLSSSPICWLTALCVRCSACAAARRFCCCATATKVGRKLSGMRLIGQYSLPTWVEIVDIRGSRCVLF